MKRNTIISLLCAFVCVLFVGKPCAAGQTYSNSIGMDFVLIPAGSFTMGTDPKREGGGESNEAPLHKVTISRPFYLGTYEVTQAQWKTVMGNNPSKFKNPDDPVEQVSWIDAQEFVKRLNAREGHTRYRLPTEAEWEYAARAGTNGAYFFGDDRKELSSYAWFEGNSADSTHPVGRKAANAWGLYDVHGNVHEWVQDWYGEKYYAGSPAADPKGPAKGSARVIRGGSWGNSPEDCRSGFRSFVSPDVAFDSVGFRLALSLE